MGKLKQRTAKRYTRKRRFYGNRYTNVPNLETDTAATTSEVEVNDLHDSDTSEIENITVTASSSKIESILIPEETEDVDIQGYRLIDMSIFDEIVKLLACPDCFTQSLSVRELTKKKKGLTTCLSIVCGDCNYSQDFLTSKPCGLKGGFDVNRRAVYAMRSLGVGYNGLRKFTMLMNMPPPMTENNYGKINKLCRTAAKKVAEKTMSDAAKTIRENKEINDDSVVADIGVSVDGTWQRRGYSSLNGVVTAISVDTGKIVDCEPMTRFCNSCAINEKRKTIDPVAYESWKASHCCKINHRGSAGSMEAEGAKHIFSRSIKNRNLRYTQFYGDGDSKSHATVKYIYPDLTIEKLECIGHVQKRVGNRLRNLRKKVKSITGKGKLTLHAIDKLQNYYGIAVRSNIGNLEAMEKAIHATLFHVASSKDNNYHDHCPSGPNSWCGAQRDKANGTMLHKPGPGFPLHVIAHLKPVFADLSKHDLLEKCLHGMTQNQNESFNNMIWERVPKTTYVGFDTLEFGVYDAISNFNIGRKASLDILEELKINPGPYTVKGCIDANKKRLSRASYQMSETTKQRRKVIRGQKKRTDDKNESTEGINYQAGAF